MSKTYQNKLKESVTISVTYFERNYKQLIYKRFQYPNCSQRDHKRRTKVRLFVLKCIHFQHFRKKAIHFKTKKIKRSGARQSIYIWGTTIF
jgi:hypothetical protein